MKKFFVFSCCFAALIFIVSCGGDSKNDNTSSDTDDPETTHDDTDSIHENQSELPECTPTSPTPCYDSSSKLIWSKRAVNKMTWTWQGGEMIWQDAVDYCNNYSEGGLSGWRLPDIDELRTLLLWNNENLCKVSEKNNCLSRECWSCKTCVEEGRISEYMGCFSAAPYADDGRYSKLGDAGDLWSSSSVSSGSAWYVNFGDQYVKDTYKDSFCYVRCVRNAE